MQWVRTGLMEAVLDDEQALASVLYFLIETPESRETGETRFATQDRHLKKSREDLHLEVGMRLGDAIAGAVDTLLLRYVMVRFLESYHPEAMQGLLKSAEGPRQSGKWPAPPEGSKDVKGELLPLGCPCLWCPSVTPNLNWHGSLQNPSVLTCQKPGRRQRVRTSGNRISSLSRTRRPLPRRFSRKRRSVPHV